MATMRGEEEQEPTFMQVVPSCFLLESIHFLWGQGVLDRYIRIQQTPNPEQTRTYREEVVSLTLYACVGVAKVPPGRQHGVMQAMEGVVVEGLVTVGVVQAPGQGDLLQMQAPMALDFQEAMEEEPVLTVEAVAVALADLDCLL